MALYARGNTTPGAAFPRNAYSVGNYSALGAESPGANIFSASTERHWAYQGRWRARSVGFTRNWDDATAPHQIPWPVKAAVAVFPIFEFRVPTYE